MAIRPMGDGLSDHEELERIRHMLELILDELKAGLRAR